MRPENRVDVNFAFITNDLKEKFGIKNPRFVHIDMTHVDSENQHEFVAKLEPFFPQRQSEVTSLVVDLAGVKSATAGKFHRELISLQKALSKTGHKVVLMDCEDKILSNLDLAGFTEIFPIYKSEM